MVYNNMITHEFSLPLDLSIKEIDKRYQRGDFSNPFYTAMINNNSKNFIRDKYGVELTQGGLWIREQTQVYKPHQENRSPNNFGFLHLSQENLLRVVLFPRRVNVIENLEDRIMKKLKENHEKIPPTTPKQLVLPI